MVAQTIEGAATEEATGVVVGCGGVVDLVTAVALEQAYEVGLDAAGEEDAAAVDFFPGIVAGDDGRFDDGDTVVTAGAEAADPDVEVSVGFDEGGSHFCGFEW